jgi:uncharacterized membrane protein
MRLAGVLILAFVAAAVAGAIGFAAVSLLPDWDDAAGRGLGDAFRGLLIAVYLIMGMLLFGLALWRSDRERHLKRARSILLLAPLLVVVLGIVNNGVSGIHWLREAVGALQMFVPLWAVTLVQWLILHRYLSQRATPAEAPATNH